jgi:ubiquinone biosynthesis monooxygenase Coq7
MEELLEPRQRSILVGIWKIAGWILGFAPLFFAGPKGLFATVAAVETYVETHYMAQIVLLKSTNSFPELTRVLEACCADEVLHQTDAANQYYQLNKFAPPPDENLTFYNSLGWFGKLWFKVVEYGSKAAVAVAMKV